MPDKSLTLLEKYDIEPQQIKKGRGGYIIETNNNSYLFQEYHGNFKKLEILEYFQLNLHPDFQTDLIIRTKENELYVRDPYEISYILKVIVPGKEFNYKSDEEIKIAFQMLAEFQKKIHFIYEDLLQKSDEYVITYQFPYHSITDSIQRHTIECKRIQKYLIHKKNKTDFERNLLASYRNFLPQALEATEKCKNMNMDRELSFVETYHPFYHGDFQYHNIIFQNTNAVPINLEHLSMGSGIRDFANLFRKICEKNNWDTKTGELMLESYITNHPLEDWEWKQLQLLLSYPIKFWKIVNHYYNSHKVNIPSKSIEKLELIEQQEKQKQTLIKDLFTF